MISPGIKPGEDPPFHELDEYTFQKLCRDLFETENSIVTCEVYGERGQSQDGIDLIAHRLQKDGIEVGQCKCHSKFPPSSIRKASEDFLDHWDRWSKENVKRFILFVACTLSRREQQDEIIGQKKRFAEFGIIYETWSSTTIRNKLRPHRGIVATYLFPREHWQEVICGETPSPIVSSSGQKTETPVIVQMALVGQISHLAARVSSDTEQNLTLMREAWRRGGKDEAVKWLQDLKSDVTTWDFLSLRTKAKVLNFEASLELDSGKLPKAKHLADEARSLDPSEDQSRLRALIAYREFGPEVAIEYLEGQCDIDSLNLKAAFLLEIGRVEECLAILNVEESEIVENEKSHS